MTDMALRDLTKDRIANIGGREINKRLIFGIASLVATAILVVALFTIDAPRPYRLLVFLPAWLAGLGFLQAREKTCIALAGRGVCNLGNGESEITDISERERLRKKSREITRRALVIAATLTLVVLAFPSAIP
jgi:hypothetical protein